MLAAAARPTAAFDTLPACAVLLLLVAGIDFDVEIKQLRATMKTVGQVLNLDRMRGEIADLGEQVAAPDLWDDVASATRISPSDRCSRDFAVPTGMPRVAAASGSDIPRK